MDAIEILLIIAVILVVILCLVLFILIDKLRGQKLHSILLERNLKTEQEEKEYYFRENRRNERELKIVKEQELKKNNNSKTIKISEKTSLVKKDTFKGKKVLVGDYNEWMLQNTRKVLMSLGFEVDTVESGDDIYDKITHGYTCDVIVTNNLYKYGERNGIDVLHDLKDIEGFNIPIVVLTVSTGARDEFVYEDGFDEYMEKVLTQKQAEEVMTRLLL